MLCGSVSPPFFLGTGLSLFHPGPAIPCSTCLHGNGWVGACSLSHATLFTRHMRTGCRGLLLFLHECLSLAWVDLWPPGWHSSCQVQTQMELAFPGYNSMVVATWLDPPCKLTQSLESDAGEGLELMFHVGHVLEWLLFFDSLPLLGTAQDSQRTWSSTYCTPPPCGRGSCTGRSTWECGSGPSSTLHSCS